MFPCGRRAGGCGDRVSRRRRLGALREGGALITYETSLPMGAPTSWPWWGGAARADADGDGMPDEWEDANGTNRNVADATVLAANGYLNIENYVNAITADSRQFFLRRPTLPASSDSTTTSITLTWRDWTHAEDGFEVEMSERGAIRPRRAVRLLRHRGRKVTKNAKEDYGLYADGMPQGGIFAEYRKAVLGAQAALGSRTPDIECPLPRPQTPFGG